MTEKTSDSPYDGPPIGTRRGDGGTYLIIADNSEEFDVARNYASSLAQTRRGYLAIAHVTNLDEFMHWGKVEAAMKQDMRRQAEEDVWKIAKSIHEEYGIRPSLYIREGQMIDTIVDIINENKKIRSLVLAGSTTGSGPGPLITYFSGKGMDRLRVPMVVVPGHLDKESIQSITNPLRLAQD